MAQPQRTAADQLEAIVPDFDLLVRDVRLGARNQEDWHRLKDEAERIALAIVTPFRGPRPGQPLVNPCGFMPSGAWGG